MEGLDLKEAPPGEDAPPPPGDDEEDGGEVVAAGGGHAVAKGDGSLGVGWTPLDVYDDDPPQIEGVMSAAHEWNYLSDMKSETYAIGGVAKAKCIDMMIDVRTELMGADMITKSVGPAVLGVKRKMIGMGKCG